MRKYAGTYYTNKAKEERFARNGLIIIGFILLALALLNGVSA